MKPLRPTEQNARSGVLHWTHRASHPASYEGSNNRAAIGCSAVDLGARACGDEAVTVGALYRSPMTECRGTHLVLLSDGQAIDNHAAAAVRALTGDASCAHSGAEACGPELLRWMYEEDQAPHAEGNQWIRTHTIAFHLGGSGQSYLQELARAGGGGFYTANTADELAQAFESILVEAAQDDTTYTAATVAVDSFGRLFHRNEVYFALFQPEAAPRWIGNVKRYRLAQIGDAIEVVDQNGLPAIDPATGFFAREATSYWTAGGDAPDGPFTSRGGAAGELSSGRQVYTFVGDYDSELPAALLLHQFNEGNSGITKALLDIPLRSDQERTQLIRWARGIDELDHDRDGFTDDARRQLGDPIHARPVILDYGSSEADPDSTLYFTTNAGFLHAIDVDDGSELFAFIPKELLPNLHTLFDNNPSDPHPYGLDGAITAYTTSSGRRLLIVGMRRGGRNYYALDVSDRTDPTLEWVIQGGQGDFAELGQSWSRPIPIRIRLDGEERELLLIGGGYDPAQDEGEVPQPDSQGRAIYLVDPESGTRVWWAGGPDSGADLVLEDLPFSLELENSLLYAVPGDIAPIDADGDGLVEKLYFGDMGGRIWRIDLHNEGNRGPSTLACGGVFAHLAGSAPEVQRRFYTTPDISLFSKRGTAHLAIAIGSGFRAHPLDTGVRDRFYLLEDRHVVTPIDWYGVTGDSEDDHTPLTEAELYDATENLISDGSASQKQAALEALDNAQGWMIRLEEPGGIAVGEKVLANSVTYDGRIIFSSFKPSIAASDICHADIGYGTAYIVDIATATSVYDLDSDGDLDRDDRTYRLKRRGIPPAPVLAIPTGDDIDTANLRPVILIGPERLPIELGQILVNLHWIDESLGL